MTPYYQEPNQILYCGLNKSWFSLARIIQLFYLVKKRFSFSRFFGANIRTNHTIMFSNLLAFTELKKQLCLLPFNFQIGQYGSDAFYCLFIRYAPSMKRLTILGTRFFYSSISGKVLRQKVNNLRSNLLQTYLLGVNRIMGIASYSHSIGASLNREVTIAIKTTCQICFCNFIHSYIIPYSVARGK